MLGIPWRVSPSPGSLWTRSFRPSHPSVSPWELWQLHFPSFICTEGQLPPSTLQGQA